MPLEKRLNQLSLSTKVAKPVGLKWLASSLSTKVAKPVGLKWLASSLLTKEAQRPERAQGSLESQEPPGPHNRRTRWTTMSNAAVNVGGA